MKKWKIIIGSILVMGALGGIFEFLGISPKHENTKNTIESSSSIATKTSSSEDVSKSEEKSATSTEKEKLSNKHVDDFISYALPQLQEVTKDSGISISMRNVGGVIAVAVSNEIKYQDTSTIQRIADSTQNAVRTYVNNYCEEKQLKVPTNSFEYPVMWFEAEDGTKIASDSNLKRTMKLEKEFLGR